MQELQIKYRSLESRSRQEVQGLRDQVDQQRQAIMELEQREQQLKNFNNSMVEVMNEIQTAPHQSQNQELAQLLVDYESIKEGNSELSSVLQEKDKRIQEISQQLQQVQQEKHTLIAQHQREIIEMNQKVMMSHTQIQRQEEKNIKNIKELQAKYKKNQEHNLKQNVQNSQLLIQKTQQIQNMSQEQDQMVHQLQVYKKQVHFMEQQSEIYRTEKQQMIDQMQAQVSENEIQKEFISNLKKQNQELQEKLGGMDRIIGQMKESNKVLKRQVYKVTMDQQKKQEEPLVNPLNRQFIHKSRNLKEKKKKGGSVVMSPDESDRENDPLQANVIGQFEEACRQIKKTKQENDISKNIQRKNEQRLNKQITAMMNQLAEVQADMMPKEKNRKQLSHSMMESKMTRPQEKYSSIPIKQRQMHYLLH